MNATSAGKTRFLGAVAFVLALVAGTANAGPRIGIADLQRVIDVPTARLSPDGKRVVIVVRRADLVDNRYVNSLMLADVTTGRQRSVAPGRVSVAEPAWSPDGEWLAWLDATTDGDTQLYLMNASGDVTGAETVRQLTHVAGGIRSFKWNPDGSSLAFVATEQPVARPAGERHLTSFEVVDEAFTARGPRPSTYLGMVGIVDGAVRRLTQSGPRIRDFTWLGDGRSILVAMEAAARVANSWDASLAIVDTREGTQRLRAQPGDFVGGPLEAILPVSPDGTFITYLQARGAQAGFSSNRIVVAPVDTGPGRDVSASIDANFTSVEWLPDAGSLIAAAPRGTRFMAWQVSSQSGEARALDLGPVVGGLRSLSVSSKGALAFIGREAGRADEVYFMANTSATPRRLTDFNHVLATFELGRTERVSWRVDGFEVDGALTYPPGYVLGKKYPLVLNIHGGPNWFSSEAFDGFNQALAAQGWLVFAPNYRGSVSSGNTFQRAIINDAIEGPVGDIMMGVNLLLARGLVDAERIAVSGWSYGGLLTASLTARNPIWRVAVAAAPVIDWLDSYSLSGLNLYFGMGFGGSPWVADNLANVWRQSPVTTVARIRTPTLILSTTGDTSVPVTHSFKLYRALKDNTVPVKFVLFAQGGHRPGDPLNFQDWHRRWLDWIERGFTEPGFRAAE